MKTYISMLVAILATLFTVNASAWNPPTSPAPKSWISDVGGTLSPEAHARLDVRLRQINSGSANELAVLILPSLDGENIEDATNATFKAWGVGKKDLDNGVLIVLAMKEHKSRIETGKGVEGDLPDLKCNDILRNVLGPQMKQHKVEAGLEASFDAISMSIANHKAEAEAAKAKAASAPTPTATTTTPPQPICDASSVGMSGGVWAILIMGMAALVIFMARRLTKKSPVQPAPKSTARARQYVAPAPVAAAVASPPVPVRPTPAPVPVPPPLPKKAKVSGITKRPSAPPRPSPKPMKKTVVAAAVATTSIVAEVEALNLATRARVKREREEREEEDRRARRAQEARQEREEEERRRKRREEDEERSSSSSSTPDWDGGSSGGGSDSGGFGGGDSGGGGSSSDW